MEGEALQIGVWGGEGLNRQTEQLCAVGFQILFIMKELKMVLVSCGFVKKIMKIGERRCFLAEGMCVVVTT